MNRNTINPSTCTRRDLFKLAGLATATLAGAEPCLRAQEAVRNASGPVKITDVKTILTQPAGDHLVIVKVLTSEPGLYGVGCATHRERPLAVAAAVDQYLKPFLVGKNCDDIEDIWQSAYVSSYFRSGVTLNNALSGADGALWDILGKRAGLPLYKMLGGKVRAAVPLYAHASARELPALEDQVRKWMAQGYRHVRVQLAVPGFSGYGASNPTSEEVQKMRPAGVAPSPVFEPTPYVNNTLRMFEHLRATLGFDVELLHDVHERVPPAQAIQLAKALEPYRLFFLEDPFAPEDAAWFQHLRQQTTTPLAMGELFVNRHEWLPLVANRWIDFIRLHISAVGGLNMARKVAACCEFFNVRTAWHGPGNVSPVGHAVNLHLDLATFNFGIQEQNVFSDTTREVFPGAPEIKGGYMYANDKPGLGIDIDEKLAAKFPYRSPGGSRGNDRRLDGTIVRP
ncbi:MAG: starvation-sensing protein RspA [Verrucomicrobia bacterium]|nr:starvation-sensing protein RspA [Verrucomicrobiota bacterium]